MSESSSIPMLSNDAKENPLEAMTSLMVHQFGPDWKIFMDAAGRQTTPETITPRLREFSAKVAGTEPIRIPVQPLAPALRCHMNVEDYCQQHPGAESVYGWIIWENAKFAEAEFHAVIRKDGKLVCITTMPDGEKELVFFEDKERKPKIEAFGDKDHIVHTFFNVHVDTAKVHPRVGMLAPGHLDPVSIPAIP